MNPVKTPLRFSADELSRRSQRVASEAVHAFHIYGTWLAAISWRRFALLSVLLMIAVSMFQSLPFFRWTFEEPVTVTKPSPVQPPVPPKHPAAKSPPAVPDVRIELPGVASAPAPGHAFEFSIDGHSVRIQERAASSAQAASTPEADTPPIGAEGAAVEIHAGDRQVRISLPAGAQADQVRQAIEEARQAIVEAIQEARDAEKEAREADQEAHQAMVTETEMHTRTVHYADFLSDLAAIWIVASAIIKITYKGRIQAEVKAAQATETAEAESLKRQVIEARMAAMQAQVEPHFLFNTLASIDHLIETDPPRASQMQKNLIALLRASMPTMRETADGGPRDLGRELAVVRPYVEILKVRMEERLDAEIDAPDGLLSAEFPAMMVQTLVENAIRHGLEPKPEGGTLRVKAEIVHGKLQVTVADTGVGFGVAATAGTGVGLANIRERLQLLHGSAASLTVTANSPCGTVVTITVPYRTVEGSARSAMA
jgi:signal transduction histidine kinase